MLNQRFLTGGLTALLVATVLAACSGGGTTPTSAAGGTNPPGAAATGPSGGGAATAGACAASCGTRSIQPCSLLNPADVQALFSVPLAATKSDAAGRCTWALADATKGDGLKIVVHVGDGEGPLDQDMSAGGTVNPVSGVGDHATFGLIAGYFPHLGAVKGQATCEISIAGDNGQLNVRMTGQAPLEAIDPAALPGFIQQVGALCNTIFAGIGA